MYRADSLRAVAEKIDVKARRKESTRKTKTYVGEQY
jgi:hypothetical protein